MTTPTNEAGHGLPELPEWSKRDDLGGLVPSQIRSELRAYARDALALSRGVPEAVLELAADLLSQCTHADALGELPDQIKGETMFRLAQSLAAAPAAAGAQGEAVAWTHDAETWGNALNEAAWVFVEECPEKSALLFNNAKGPLRAAILKYAELVGATTPQPAAADGGVRERARELFDAMLAAPYGSTTMGDIVCAETTCNRLESAWLPILEAALSSHRQAGDAFDWIIEITGNPAYPVRITEPAGVNAWEPHASSLGAKFILAVKKLLAAPPPGAELSKFRELAKRWQANGHPYVSDCADELIALVEKGAGNG